MFRISLSTGSFGLYPLASVFAIAKEIGFDGVELLIVFESAFRSAKYLKALSRQYDLPILSLHAPVIPMPGWGARPFHERTMALATELGCSVVTFHALRPGVSEEVFRSRRNAYREAQQSCHNGLEMTIENITPKVLKGSDGPGAETAGPSHSLNSVLAMEDFPVTFDTCHASLDGGDIRDTYERLRGRIRNIHFSDIKSLHGQTRSILFNSLVFHHQVPGSGELPLKELLGMLVNDGYDGLLTLELSPIGLQAWNPRRMKENLSRALAFCREHSVPPRG